jgi:hypothetical protein
LFSTGIDTVVSGLGGLVVYVLAALVARVTPAP